MDKLHSTFRKITVSKYSVFILFFLIMLIVLLPAQLWPGSDDGVYLEQLERMGLLEWVWMRATTWQPRLVSDFLIGAFGFYIPVWRVVTATITTLLLFAICKMVDPSKLNPEQSQYHAIITCCAFFVIFPNVISSSIIWYTGSFNYLWPTFFMIIALVPCYWSFSGKVCQNKFVIAASLLCAALSSYNEQNAAILGCYCVVTILYLVISKRKIPAHIIILLFVVAANVGIYISIGGTSIRESTEIFWYKSFPMLSMMDKLFQGVNWANYHLINGSNVLYFLLLGLLFLKYHVSDHSKIVKVMASIPMLFVGLRLIPFGAIFENVASSYLYGINGIKYEFPIDTAISLLTNPMLATPENLKLGLFELIPGFLNFTLILYTGALLFVVFENKNVALANTLLYFAALASSYAVSISPTIFASGNRIFFATDILLVLLCSVLTKEVFLTENLCKKKWYNCAVIVLVIIAACFILVNLSSHFLDIPKF